MSPARPCEVGHELGGTPGRPCATCRRQMVASRVAEADAGLSTDEITAAIDAVVTSPAVLRDLAAALADGPRPLLTGAPAVVGRLVAELRARGSELPEARCAACGRVDRPLVRSGEEGVCPRCRSHELAEVCGACGERRPVISRHPDGSPRCWRCNDRPRRRCGICGEEAFIARRAKDGDPDVCNRCFRPPVARCGNCGRHRPCYFVAAGRPRCSSCAPRRSAPCAHCGVARPPCVRWPEGPVCEPCYRAALGRRGACASCGKERRLVSPPGKDARLCCDCAGVEPLPRCSACGIEDRLYEHGFCGRCALAERARGLLTASAGFITAGLVPVYEALVAARQPFSALNWLRSGKGAAILADMAAGRLAISHEALDAHPQAKAAGYLRCVLVANGALPARHEHLVRLEHWVKSALEGIERPDHRRMVNTYATWVILRGLRRRADAGEVTHTRLAKTRINAAIDLLAWLDGRGYQIADLTQGGLERFFESSRPSDTEVGDFLGWAARHRYTTATLQVARRQRQDGPVLDDDTRWAVVARLLSDDTLELTDRVAGCLVLLYGQQLSRIVAITVDQLNTDGSEVHLRLGRDHVVLPEPLGGLALHLSSSGRRYVGVGTPTTSRWLFPGHLPGRALSAQHLGQRLRNLSIEPRAGRRSAMIHLAARMPAAVLAQLLNLHPTTAVHWVRAAGGDWSTYAAMLARDRDREER